MLHKYINKLFLALLIFAIPLYQKFPLIDIPGTFVRVRLEDFLMATLMVYTVYQLMPKIRDIFKSKLNLSIFLFLAAGMVSLVSAIFITSTVNPVIGLLHWGRRVEYFTPFFFALTLPTVDRKEYLEYTVKILFVVVLVVALYGFGQKNLGWPVIATQDSEASKGIALKFTPGAHLASTFAGHYDLASFMVLVLPVAAAGIFLIKDKLVSLLSVVVLISGLWLLASSLSRISIVSYLIALFISMMIIRRKAAFVYLAVISIIVFSFSSSLLDRYLSIIRVVKDNLNQVMLIQVPTAHAVDQNTKIIFHPSVLALEDRSTSIRLNIEWPRAMRAFLKNPLLGTGYSSITLATDNDFLRLLGEVGLLGLLAFLALITRLLIKFASTDPLKNIYSPYESAAISGFTGGFVGLLLNAVFIDVFEASKIGIMFWLLAGLVVYSSKGANNEKNS